MFEGQRPGGVCPKRVRLVTGLIEILPEAFDVEIGLVYATPDNVTGRPVYAPDAACFLHAAAAPLLSRAAELFRPLGLKLRILDAFRPQEAQRVLWNHDPDPKFLTDPARGSPHSRGVAVDVTLVERGTGTVLDMGSGFDDFRPQSHHGRTDINPGAQRNRALLLGVMTAAGWDCYLKEWWHYQLFGPRAYPLISDRALARSMLPTRTAGTAGA